MLQIPSSSLSLHPAQPEALPGRLGDVLTPACPGPSLGSPLGGTSPENCPRHISGRPPIQMPELHRLALVDSSERRLYFQTTRSLRETPDILLRKLSRLPTAHDQRWSWLLLYRFQGSRKPTHKGTERELFLTSERQITVVKTSHRYVLCLYLETFLPTL